MDKSPKQVMVLLPFERDRQALKEVGSGYELHWMTDERLSWTAPDDRFDIVAYTERCSRYLERHPMDGVLYSHEPANLVAAELCRRHDLPGPDLESMFVANHKYYSRQRESDPIWWDHIDLDSGRWGRRKPTFPCYIKPPYLWQSLFQHRIDSPAQLAAVLELLRPELPPHCKPYLDFFARYIDAQRYPLALANILQVEEFIGHRDQHCVMGWSRADGQQHIWGVYDRSFYPGPEKAADISAAPSQLGADKQQRLIDCALDNVQRHNIRNGFWNVDLCFSGDRVVIIEVNGRAASVWHQLHQLTFGNSLFKAMLHLCCDEPEQCLEESRCRDAACQNRVGGQFHAVTFGEGRAGDLLDYDFIRTLDEPQVQLFLPADGLVRQTSSGGFWLARFHLFGWDFDTINRQADDLRARMLKQPQLSPRIPGNRM